MGFLWSASDVSSMLLLWRPLICLSHILYCIICDASCSYRFRLKDHGQIKEVKRTIIRTVMATSLLIAVLHSVGPSLQGKSMKSMKMKPYDY